MADIVTARLVLRAFEPPMIDAALHDRARLPALVGAAVPEEWPMADFGGILRLLAESAARHPEAIPRTRLMIHAAEQAVIGDIGLREVSEGVWELGYSVLPAYRRQGYTLEAARAIVAWAFEHPEVRQVIAECDNENLGSVRLLERLGMRRVSQEDHVILWELARPGA